MDCLSPGNTHNDVEKVKEALYYIHISAVIINLEYQPDLTSLALAARLGHYDTVNTIMNSDAFKSALVEYSTDMMAGIISQSMQNWSS